MKSRQERMGEFEITRATVEDEQALCEIFLNHITSHTEYISHGEIQMGVGLGHFEDGRLVAEPSPRAKEYWMKYIHTDITSDEAAVFKAVLPDGEIIGFTVAEIQEDGADPFGMVCDVLVDETRRCGGVGSSLLSSALAWFKEKGIKDIYLESGLNNHAAHEYFKRRGFVKVSEIYKLM
ncbi:MAG: GNAT family N-acetyltransferase [Bacteroidales bacterium]|nr:GNAT family N-acetyltransferase [Bacteroidales bacterium]